MTLTEVTRYKPNLGDMSPRAQAAIDFVAPIGCPNSTNNRNDLFCVRECLIKPDSGLVTQGEIQVVDLPSSRLSSIVLHCQGWELDRERAGKTVYEVSQKYHPCTPTNCPLFRRPATIRASVA